MLVEHRGRLRRIENAEWWDRPLCHAKPDLLCWPCYLLFLPLVMTAPTRPKRSLIVPVIAVQAVVLTAIGLAFALSPSEQRSNVRRIVTATDVLATPVPPRTEPLSVGPLYDRLDFVSDD